MEPTTEDDLPQGPTIVTWTLVALNVLVYLWDRQGQIFGPSIVFGDLAMRANEVVAAVAGRTDSFPLVTLFTHQFLHGGPAHLFGNMLALAMFGPAVEEALGSPRFALYYLAWGFAAAGAQIYVDPGAATPMVGASGAIGGALGAVFLLFPEDRIVLAIPFWWPEIKAWIVLGAWFLWQVFIPQEGVANWAHVGGFVAGMATVLIMGGRAKVLHEDLPEPP